MGYHFYQGRYLDALGEVLDPSKKTIIHIPNVNSGEAAVDKYSAVDHIIDTLGEFVEKDRETGIITVKAHDGRLLKLADLVDDRKTSDRSLIQAYLRNIKSRDDMDIIIALGMAKEGFDWPYCEHVLTIGYRSSMTEVVQIIGRATRDCEGKTHAQFTNLIAQPDATDEDVKVSVNNLLKAITLSLLMEQVLAPNITFRRRSDMRPDEQPNPGDVIIDDTTLSASKKVVDILNKDSDDLIAALVQDTQNAKRYIQEDTPASAINETALPKIVACRYPELSVEEQDQIVQGTLTKMAVTQGGGIKDGKDLPDNALIEGEKTYIRQGDFFVDTVKLQEAGQSYSVEETVRERDLPDNAKNQKSANRRSQNR